MIDLATLRTTDAEQGSQKLADAIREQFFRFACRHGVTMEDAKLLCMNPTKLKVWPRR